jgi:hypothetical protein
MKVEEKIKVKILTQLFSANKNSWRVVGITQKALEAFKKNNFEYVKGINRSHISDRSPNYKRMMKRKFKDENEFWKYYFKNDKTVFATSSENNRKKYSAQYKINDKLGLFTTRGYTWRQGKNEQVFLENLHKKRRQLPRVKII